MPVKLGILAGAGELPRLLIATCRHQNRAFHVLAFMNQAEKETVDGSPHQWIRLGEAGASFELLRAAQVEEVVFAGKFKRPTLADLRPDWRTTRFIAHIGGRLLSDNRLLEAIVKDFEREGFRVIGPADVVASLLARVGSYGTLLPSAEETKTIAIGFAAARHNGLIDQGQAAVVQDERVLGLEGPQGTDALIEYCVSRQRGGGGAILVKARKPQQEMRSDPPVIGLATVTRAAAAGFRGIAVEAGGVLVLDESEIAIAADDAGLFVVGLQI